MLCGCGGLLSGYRPGRNRRLQLQAKSKVCYVGVVGYYSGHYKFLK